MVMPSQRSRRVGKQLDEPPLIDTARRSAGFLFAQMVDKNTFKIRRSWMNGSAAIEGVCDDYAAIVDACLALHNATGEEQWLDYAQRVQHRQLVDFLEPETGAFLDVARDRTDIFLRLRPAFDADVISPNALTARNLVRLSRASAEPQASTWKRTAEKLFDYFETTADLTIRNDSRATGCLGRIYPLLISLPARLIQCRRFFASLDTPRNTRGTRLPLLSLQSLPPYWWSSFLL